MNELYSKLVDDVKSLIKTLGPPCSDDMYQYIEKDMARLRKTIKKIDTEMKKNQKKILEGWTFGGAET